MAENNGAERLAGMSILPGGQTMGEVVNALEDIEAREPAPRGLPKVGKATKQVKLSNGAVAEVREARGADLEKAAVVAQAGGGGEIAIALALVAQVTTIGGEGIAYEDLREAPLGDVSFLLGAVSGNGLSLGLGT